MPAAQHDPRQQHYNRHTRASRKHAATPDSATRKQHRQGQQGLHCRAASQAPNSTTQTARTTTDARSEPHAALRVASLGPWAIASAAEACIARRRPRLHSMRQARRQAAPSTRRSATHARGPRQDPRGARRHRTTAAAVGERRRTWRDGGHRERRERAAPRRRCTATGRCETRCLVVGARGH
eukprot:6451941-Prymnesium_polylepis.1